MIIVTRRSVAAGARIARDLVARGKTSPLECALAWGRCWLVVLLCSQERRLWAARQSDWASCAPCLSSNRVRTHLCLLDQSTHHYSHAFRALLPHSPCAVRRIHLRRRAPLTPHIAGVRSNAPWPGWRSTRGAWLQHTLVRSICDGDERGDRSSGLARIIIRA